MSDDADAGDGDCSTLFILIILRLLSALPSRSNVILVPASLKKEASLRNLLDSADGVLGQN